MDPIEFGGQRSKVKVKSAVNQIQIKPFRASSSNLADKLTMVYPIDFGGHSSKVGGKLPSQHPEIGQCTISSNPQS